MEETGDWKRLYVKVCFPLLSFQPGDPTLPIPPSPSSTTPAAPKSKSKRGRRRSQRNTPYIPPPPPLPGRECLPRVLHSTPSSTTMEVGVDVHRRRSPTPPALQIQEEAPTQQVQEEVVMIQDEAPAMIQDEAPAMIQDEAPAMIPFHPLEVLTVSSDEEEQIWVKGGASQSYNQDNKVDTSGRDASPHEETSSTLQPSPSMELEAVSSAEEEGEDVIMKQVPQTVKKQQTREQKIDKRLGRLLMKNNTAEHKKENTPLQNLEWSDVLSERTERNREVLGDMKGKTFEDIDLEMRENCDKVVQPSEGFPSRRKEYCSEGATKRVDSLTGDRELTPGPHAGGVSPQRMEEVKKSKGGNTQKDIEGLEQGTFCLPLDLDTNNHLLRHLGFMDHGLLDSLFMNPSSGNYQGVSGEDQLETSIRVMLTYGALQIPNSSKLDKIILMRIQNILGKIFQERLQGWVETQNLRERVQKLEEELSLEQQKYQLLNVATSPTPPRIDSKTVPSAAAGSADQLVHQPPPIQFPIFPSGSSNSSSPPPPVQPAPVLSLSQQAKRRRKMRRDFQTWREEQRAGAERNKAPKVQSSANLMLQGEEYPKPSQDFYREIQTSGQAREYLRHLGFQVMTPDQRDCLYQTFLRTMGAQGEMQVQNNKIKVCLQDKILGWLHPRNAVETSVAWASLDGIFRAIVAKTDPKTYGLFVNQITQDDKRKLARQFKGALLAFFQKIGKKWHTR